MRARAARAPWVAGVLAGLLATALTGCGGDGATPVDQVPALQGRLDAVDQAVSDGQPAAVRRAVNRLERTAYDAERSGDLDHADAAAIVSAADALVAALPARQPSSSSSPTPSPTPTERDSEEPPEPPGHDKPEKEPKAPKPKEPKGPGHGHGPGHDKH